VDLKFKSWLVLLFHGRIAQNLPKVSKLCIIQKVVISKCGMDIDESDLDPFRTIHMRIITKKYKYCIEKTH
jgi:hypothetical protein